ncbi:MAG: LptA/OstA family protein, partial [Pseudomonadota bacterium]
MTAKLSDAEVLTKEGTIRSNNPVAVTFPAGTLNGNKMLVRQKQREVIFSSGVVARLVPQKAKSAKDPVAKPKASTGGLMSFASQSSDPVDVQADILFVKDNQSSARFSGQVRASQGDAALTARVLDIAYGQDGEKNASPGSANLKRLIARDNVVMTRGQDRIVSAVADFDVAANRGVLNGGVVMTSGADRKVMASRADIDSSKDTILLTGQKVVVVQGENSLEGTRLFYDQPNGIMHLTSPGTKTSAAGRVRAKFASQRQRTAKQTVETVRQSSGALGQSFKTDPNAPVEVVANSLTVNDQKREAVFQGGVEAMQGGFGIKTEVLRAKYSGSAGGALQGASSDNNAEGRSTNAQLESIHAPGRIVVTSRDGQKAEGDS